MSTPPDPIPPEPVADAATARHGPSVSVPVAFLAALLVWGWALGGAGSTTSSGLPLLLGVVFGVSSPLLVLGLFASAIVVAARWRGGAYQPAASPAGLAAWFVALSMYATAIAWLFLA